MAITKVWCEEPQETTVDEVDYTVKTEVLNRRYPEPYTIQLTIDLSDES